ncbi:MULTISPECIES: N-6 DNA methylase [Bacteroidales]|uniref:site-specific DNA-methyltransferase (adenine-specific) n=5 Tax=cellular organisms TaxID=131567 RepID=A0AAW6GIT8_BACUN|nr:MULTISPECIES: N-6 DNA methylase [Bacteroidales]MCY6362137.1 N-6 DNA methylase [Bacteroides thetaiotaomicron]MCB6981165.1 N-6 DNA methylase [Bacteroides uniformis]MCB7028255.1 N-6 DNA methylase [Bacteroides uniformis]MCB7406667.1 N-6 DNA methylase [Bacteroides uniformis]MCB7417803.1 N-6 DNA methylase [Bacteroides uniformis]
MELFVQMFYRVSEYSEGFCDVLGDMFMECVSHGNNGQFFTPIHVADLMACMGGNRLKPKQSVCDSCCGSGRMLLSAVKKCAEENDGGRLFCYGSDIDLICVKMTVVNLMMNSVPGEVAWMNTLTMQHWRSYHIDLQLIAGVWLPILKITEAGDTSFIRKLENAMEDNSELKRSIQSNARATQLTFDF